MQGEESGLRSTFLYILPFGFTVAGDLLLHRTLGPNRIFNLKKKSQ